MSETNQNERMVTPHLPEAQCPDCFRHVDPSQDDYLNTRVCELCGADEPDGDDHGQHCPSCDKDVWWLPKCPSCGTGADFIYSEEELREA